MWNTCRTTVTYTWSLNLCLGARCSRICEGLASLGQIRRLRAGIEKSTAALSSETPFARKGSSVLASLVFTFSNCPEP